MKNHNHNQKKIKTPDGSLPHFANIEVDTQQSAVAVSDHLMFWASVAVLKKGAGLHEFDS